jgi:hypothetical protein
MQLAEAHPDEALERQLLRLTCLWAPLTLVVIFASWHLGKIPLRLANHLLPANFRALWRDPIDDDELQDDSLAAKPPNGSSTNTANAFEGEGSDERTPLLQGKKESDFGRSAANVKRCWPVQLVAVLQFAALIAEEAYKLVVTRSHPLGASDRSGEIALWVSERSQITPRPRPLTSPSPSKAFRLASPCAASTAVCASGRLCPAQLCYPRDSPTHSQ